MKTKPTKIEIIDRIIKHINKQGRAVSPTGMCVYLTKNNRYCADSFLLKPSYRSVAHGNCENIIHDFGNGAYQKQYQGHESDFHLGIQTLHDHKNYWESDDKTLSQKGIKEVERLKEKWS